MQAHSNCRFRSLFLSFFVFVWFKNTFQVNKLVRVIKTTSIGIFSESTTQTRRLVCWLNRRTMFTMNLMKVDGFFSTWSNVFFRLVSLEKEKNIVFDLSSLISQHTNIDVNHPINLCGFSLSRSLSYAEQSTLCQHWSSSSQRSLCIAKSSIISYSITFTLRVDFEVFIFSFRFRASVECTRRYKERRFQNSLTRWKCPLSA